MIDVFHFKTESPGQGIYIFSFSGNLDELAELPSLVDLVNVRKITFDFMGLKFISSVGIKSWIMMIDNIKEIPGIEIEFSNCPKSVIDCVNSIEGFLPEQGYVSSFKIPYFCEECDQSFTVLEPTSTVLPHLDKYLNEQKTFPEKNCPTCQKRTEIDLPAPRFLKFLKK